MPSHAHETQFLTALWITLVVETVLLFLVVRILLKQPATILGNGSVLSAGILASALTLPYVWFVLPAFISSYQPYVLVAEGLALLVETLVLQILLRLSVARALAASAVCNGGSFLVGQIIKAVG